MSKLERTWFYIYSTALVIASIFIFARVEAAQQIAHRGAYKATGLVENTRSAFERAYQENAWIETDSFLTSDGVPLISHDQDLTRTTNCDGWLIKEHTLSEIKNNCYTDDNQAPLTVREAMWIVYYNTGQHIQFEVKGNWPSRELIELSDILTPIIGRAWIANDNGHEVLIRVRDVAPELKTTWKPTPEDQTANRVTPAYTRSIGAESIMLWPWEWTRTLADNFRSNGIKPWARMANDPLIISGLEQKGVGAYLTDTVGQ